MRTGLVGLGEIGQHHSRAIRACADADLVAICDLDAELVESTREGGEAGFTDLARMLAASELEALDVCLPHSLHLEAAAAATAAGCHVLLEKPMAIDVAACDVLIEAAAAADVRIAVSHNQLFYEPHRRLIAAAADGSLGELRQIYARLWIGDRYRGWRERPEIVGGGLLMDAGVHRVYLLRAIGGPVTGVTAMMDVPRAEEAFTVWLEFATGVTGVIQGSYFAPGGVFDDRVDAVGTAGSASVAGCEAYFEGDLRDVPQLRVRLGDEWRDEVIELMGGFTNRIRRPGPKRVFQPRGARGRPDRGAGDSRLDRRRLSLGRVWDAGGHEDLLSDVGSRA